MSKNLPVRQNTQIALRKAKSLIGTTGRILAKRETRLATSDDGWMQRLWDWADENNIPDADEEITLENLAEFSERFPREKEGLLGLTKWESSGRKIKTLAPEIGRLVNLESLYIFRNQLTELPPEIGLLVNLTWLCLCHNELTKLLPEIGRLSELLGLELDGNQLTKLPPEIGQLVNLDSFYLSCNQLTKLPPEIGLLMTLKTLDLGENALTNLPPEIGQLVNLEFLYLYHNRLTKLPPEIINLTKLKSLSLYGNPRLILTAEQKKWIETLQKNGCEVSL